MQEILYGIQKSLAQQWFGIYDCRDVWLGRLHGRHRQSGEQRLGRGLRGERVQARLGRRKGWEDGLADGPNRGRFVKLKHNVVFVVCVLKTHC